MDKADISDDDMAKLKADLPAVKITWNRPSPAEVERMRKELRGGPSSVEQERRAKSVEQKA